MNERIKEIALQAGGSHYPNVNSMQLEKFAELIIRECANITDEHESLNTWTKKYSTLIKEHFEVE